MMLKKGTIAPGFSLTSAEGEPFKLDPTRPREEHLLLVFLRHLG